MPRPSFKGRPASLLPFFVGSIRSVATAQLPLTVQNLDIVVGPGYVVKISV